MRREELLNMVTEGITIPKGTVIYKGFRSENDVPTRPGVGFYTFDISEPGVKISGLTKAFKHGDVVVEYVSKHELTFPYITHIYKELYTNQMRTCKRNKQMNKNELHDCVMKKMCQIFPLWVNKEDIFDGGFEVFICDPSVLKRRV